MSRLIIVSIVLFSISFKGYSAMPILDEKGKWGIIESDGTYIVKPKYSMMENLGNGYFMIATGGKIKDGVIDGEKWGVINSNGEIILKPQYDEIGDFINGLATITIGEKKGFVNEEWKIVAEPIYNFVGTPNKQGFVWVNLGGKPDKQHIGRILRGKYGVINSEGRIIVPVSYNAIGYVPDQKFQYDEKSIYAAQTGFERLMIECGSQYSLWPKPIETCIGSIIPQSIGFAFSNKPNLNFNGITNLTGDILVERDIYQRVAAPSNGLALVYTKNNSVGFYSISSKSMIENNEIRSAFSYDGNFTIAIDKNNKWSFYDENLSRKGEFYDWISPRIGQTYLVKKDDSMSLISAQTLEPIVSNKALIFPIKNGLMAFKDLETEMWGFLREDGSVAVEPKYIYAFSFNHGVSCVENHNGWGIISAELKEIVTPKWKSIIFPNEDSFDKIWVMDDSGIAPYRCLNINTDSYSFDAAFTDAWNFREINGNEYATVKKGSKYGQINSSGEIIIPFEFESKHISEEALAYRIKHGIDNWKPIHSYRFNLLWSKTKKYTIKDTLPNDKWDY